MLLHSFIFQGMFLKMILKKCQIMRQESGSKKEVRKSVYVQMKRA